MVADILNNIIPPEELALHSIRLLEIFKNPLWWIESNDYGGVTIATSQGLGYKNFGYDNFQVIFCTANDQHALRAFEFSAVDYLVKPISVDDLKKSISKFKKLNSIDKRKTPYQMMRSFSLALRTGRCRALSSSALSSSALSSLPKGLS